MPEILYELYSRSYYAPLGSISGCLCISILITIFTLPFFTSFYIGSIIYIIQTSGQALTHIMNPLMSTSIMNT